jgi:threonyl-tRNA synthetase
VLPITDDHAAGAGEIVGRLKEAGLLAQLDVRSDTLNYRIRDGEMNKIPYLLVVGDRELEAGTVAVRARGAEKKQVVMPVQEFIDRVTDEIRTRALAP